MLFRDICESCPYYSEPERGDGWWCSWNRKPVKIPTKWRVYPEYDIAPNECPYEKDHLERNCERLNSSSWGIDTDE